MSLKKTSQVEQHLSNIEAAKVFFEELAEKKQTAFDNKSEKWQESEAGEQASENISSIEEIRDSLDEAYGNIENLFEE